MGELLDSARAIERVHKGCVEVHRVGAVGVLVSPLLETDEACLGICRVMVGYEAVRRMNFMW